MGRKLDWEKENKKDKARKQGAEFEPGEGEKRESDARQPATESGKVIERGQPKPSVTEWQLPKTVEDCSRQIEFLQDVLRTKPRADAALSSVRKKLAALLKLRDRMVQPRR